MVYLAEQRLTKYQGTLVGVFEIVFEIWALASCTALLRKYKNLFSISITLFFLALLIADFSYVYFYYLMKIQTQTTTIVVLTRLFYPIAFLFLAVSVIANFKRKKNLFKRWPTLFILVFTTPIFIKFVIGPYLNSPATQREFLLVFSEVASIFASYILLNFCLIVFLSSNRIFLSTLVCGGIILTLGDWAMRIDNFNNNLPIFGIYEFAWCFGVIMTCLPVVVNSTYNEKSTPAPNQSIIFRLKSSALILICISEMMVLFFSEKFFEETTRFIFISSSLALVIANFLCFYLAEQIRTFGKSMAHLISDAYHAEKKFSEVELQGLPYELQDTYFQIYKERIAIDKINSAKLHQQEILLRMNELHCQLAHDIRSPLAALEMGLVDMKGHQPQLQKAVQRIREIANGLLKKSKDHFDCHASDKTNLNFEELSLIITDLIAEKRLQFKKNKTLKIETYFSNLGDAVFMQVDVFLFKRILSNLINNSAEAYWENEKKIIVKTDCQYDKVVVKISDNGPGIPADILPKLCQKGATFGKADGNGLGLYHAKKTVEAWGGDFAIESTLGKGTTVSFTVPVAKVPVWFAKELSLTKATEIVIVDDDPAVLALWRQRLVGINVTGPLHEFRNPEDFEFWLAHHPNHENRLYLFDHDLGVGTVNGLDLIEKHEIAQQSILVTGRAYDTLIQEHCQKLGVKLLPKEAIAELSIDVIGFDVSKQAVLIDDDDLIRDFWRKKASDHGVHLDCFSCYEDFHARQADYERETRIFIDSQLHNRKGEDCAKELSNLGFRHISLTTGFDKNRFAGMPWIDEVMGKSPPW